MSANSPTAVITVRGLRKSYANVEAVCGLDFDVFEGEVFGLLGPNGAGKTTTIEILEGLRQPTAGYVRVLGYDPTRQSMAIKDRIGVSLQATNLPEKIKVVEAVELFQAFYSRSVDTLQLLKRLQLEDKRDAYYSTLSGGQKQRLALALAMVNDPQLLFLDEPTTGLDPQVRLEIHGLIQELRDAKRTILLTTHYIEEAEKLCDRVAIVDSGRIIELGAPAEIQRRTLGNSLLELHTAQPLPEETIPSFCGAEKLHFSADRKQMMAHTTKPARTLVEIVKWVDQLGIELTDIHLKRPTLEDVFLELTGRRLRD
ncbi:MAG: ATP-binding cassette domain-containing protein [Bryobacteraceae bacterium]|nr:ATP-binding cassette domain-containing protein [Bryobacteraceae bacterium]MDW8380406.1 ATP-binding cassette domain-containing protein [Bryobacterales bacterium]